MQLKREELAYRAATALWSDPNKYITLDVNIPENGVYDLRLITGKNADSGKVDVFFDDQRVGQYDAYDSAATSDACSWSDMLDIGSVALKAGVHQLKFQVLNRLELRIKKVALYKTAELADFSIDFRSCLTEEHGADPMHATFSNHNWQFDKAGSDADGFQWAKMIDQGFAARYNWIAGAEGAKRVAFDFMVPESGYYDMDMVVGMNVDGAQFRTYIDGIRLDVKQNPSYPDRIFSYQAGSGVVFSEPIALPKQIGLNKGKHRLVFELIYNSEVRPIVINFYKRGQYGADYEIDFRTCCANDHATDRCV